MAEAYVAHYMMTFPGFRPIKRVGTSCYEAHLSSRARCRYRRQPKISNVQHHELSSVGKRRSFAAAVRLTNKRNHPKARMFALTGALLTGASSHQSLASVQSSHR